MKSDCQQLKMIQEGDGYTKNGLFNSNHDSSTHGASVIIVNVKSQLVGFHCQRLNQRAKFL